MIDGFDIVVLVFLMYELDAKNQKYGIISMAFRPNRPNNNIF
jgi:hypothetical protein